MNMKYLLAATLGCTMATAAAAQQYAPPQASSAPYCREFTQKVLIGGVPKTTYGTSCMQPDGSWQVMPSDPAQGAPQAATMPPAGAVAYPPGAVAYSPAYPVVAPPVYYGAPYYAAPYYGPAVGVDLSFGHGGYGYHNGYREWRR